MSIRSLGFIVLAVVIVMMVVEQIKKWLDRR
jgi:hypothetical protein